MNIGVSRLSSTSGGCRQGAGILLLTTSTCLIIGLPPRAQSSAELFAQTRDLAASAASSRSRGSAGDARLSTLTRVRSSLPHVGPFSLPDAFFVLLTSRVFVLRL